MKIFIQKYRSFLLFFFPLCLLMFTIYLGTAAPIWAWGIAHVWLFSEAMVFKHKIFSKLNALNDYDGHETMFSRKFLTFNISYQIFFLFLTTILLVYISIKCSHEEMGILCMAMFHVFKFSLLMNYIMEIHKLIFYYKVIGIRTKLPVLVEIMFKSFHYIRGWK